MKYTPVSSISMILRKSGRKKEVLYIQGGIGIGKTAAVSYYLKRKKAIWFDGEPGYLENIPDQLPEGEDVVVVDNISWIRDYSSKEFILQIIRQGGRQIILIGRGDLPDWLAPISTQIPFSFATREDVLPERSELENILLKEPSNLKTETMEKILHIAYDNPLFYFILRSRVVNGVLTDENFNRAKTSYYYVLDDRFFNLLEKEERSTLIVLCSFDRFNLEMARRVTTNSHTERTIEKLLLHDACLVREGEEYIIPEPYRSYLLWKQSIVLEPYKRINIYNMAASYYAEKDDLFTAASYYRKAGANDMVEETVLRICDDPDMVLRNLYRINSCLDVLTLEQSLNNPLLMATRSMVHSLLMNHERSEVWYGRLVEFGERTDLGRNERNETEFYLACLDLILPHRSSAQWIVYFEKYLEARKRYNGQYKSYSNTLLGYSVLNGLFDFSQMIAEKGRIDQLKTVSKQHKEFMKEETSLIIRLFGQEIALEQGNLDEAVFNTVINKIILEAERRGLDDIRTAAVVHYAKMRIIQGDIADAEKIISQLGRTINEDAILTKVVQSILVWYSLLKGDPRLEEEWLLQAPDSREYFSLLDRNDYILKARILIRKGEYQYAKGLLARLNIVYEEYNRDYVWISAKLLSAVMLYRTNDPLWKKDFTEALKRAESFRYIRVIADEGIAVLPLFEELSQKERKQFDKNWYDRTEETVREMAGYYPDYMQEKSQVDVSLTKAESRVMRYLCQGMSSEEICDQLHISYSGLKYHKRNIYRKMGTRTLEEAISIAKTMGIDK